MEPNDQQTSFYQIFGEMLPSILTNVFGSNNNNLTRTPAYQSSEPTVYPPSSMPLQQPTSAQHIDPNLAFWAVIDGVLLVFIVGGNILTILAVRFSRRLRTVISNLFILSLAISDMVVGFTLPYHLAFYMGSNLGNDRGWCLLRFFLIILACCVSIWNLIAIAVDRYIAIVYPLHYSRYITKKVALIIISVGWAIGSAFAMIPMFWNNWETAAICEFNEILPLWYVVGVITPAFTLVWICMLILYWRIWREASKHAKQLRSSFSGLQDTPASDWKSVQVVLFILGCFSLCWIPYFFISCAQMFKFFDRTSPMLYKGVFSLAMLNSALNPIIYAWKNTNFRKAFSRLLHCRSPDYNDFSEHSNRSNNNLHNRRQSTLSGVGGMMSPPPSALTGKFTILDANYGNFIPFSVDRRDSEKSSRMEENRKNELNRKSLQQAVLIEQVQVDDNGNEHKTAKFYNSIVDDKDRGNNQNNDKDKKLVIKQLTNGNGVVNTITDQYNQITSQLI